MPLARQAKDAGLRTLPAGPMNPRFEKEKKRYLELEARRKKSSQETAAASS